MDAIQRVWVKGYGAAEGDNMNQEMRFLMECSTTFSVADDRCGSAHWFTVTVEALQLKEFEGDNAGEIQGKRAVELWLRNNRFSNVQARGSVFC